MVADFHSKKFDPNEEQRQAIYKAVIDMRAKREARRIVASEDAALARIMPERLMFGEELPESPPDSLLRTDGIGLFRSGGVVHSLFGPKESAKTTIALLLAIERLSVGERVAWIDYEMGKVRLVNRMRALGFTSDVANFFYFYMNGKQVASAVEEAVLREPHWTILDSVGRAISATGVVGGENSTEGFMWVLDAMEPLKVGGSLVLIDHSGHSESHRSRGTSMKGQQVDVEYQMEVTKRWTRADSRGEFKLITRKDRDGYYVTDQVAARGEVAVLSRHMGVSLRAPDVLDTVYDDFRLAEVVVDVLKTEAKPMSAPELARRLSRRDDDMRMILGELEKDGKVVKDGRRWTVPKSH